MSEQKNITEWEFTSSVQSWINAILASDKTLPFKEAKCEQRDRGSLKRRDLTLIALDGSNALTGEVKLPWASDGGSPFNEEVVLDARKKAASAKTNYFFTWNVNELVLWETFKKDDPRAKREYKSFKIESDFIVRNATDLTSAATERQIQKLLERFLREYAQLYKGEQKIGVRPLDDKFIDQLESFLQRPIHLIFEHLDKNYSGKFKKDLDTWMRDEQGWVIYDERRDNEDNLRRAAQYTAYDLMIRLVFYEAMYKRYSGSLEPLDVPDHIDTGEGLKNHIAALFKTATNVTGDYETVFIDHTQLGNRIPFFADQAVPYWRDLVNQIERYDFSKLKYDVIGRIFERLLLPEERHKYGQYYTRPEVVDLINSFCVRKPDAKVLDPACGGGTFLVRAYARKKNLDPSRKHGQLLSDIYGVDLDGFAAHLTMINLATRDLIDEENYPQIARMNFFNVKKTESFLRLPANMPHAKMPHAKMASQGLGKATQREVHMKALDAIVGNPPYVRQEQIKSIKPKRGADPEKETKEYYLAQAKDEWKGLKLSGRSDLHIYFWPHASTFLAEEGYFGFLTSSQWMDVEYGFDLQRWILKNFEIVAIFESVDEPWFIGARVATVITVLKRQSDEKKRMANVVRFVQLRRSIAEILENDGTTAGQMLAVDSFRDEILALESDSVNERYRARLIPQKKLWEDGVRLGAILGKSKTAAKPEEDDDEAEEAPPPLHGDYYGGKWGLYVRAPDLWFDLLDETGKKWAPLGEVSEIKRGVTSGKDVFFFPKDFSAEALEQEKYKEDFYHRFGAKRSDVEKGKVKIVKAGEGYSEVHAIEAKYLEPEVHSLMEIDGYIVKKEDCSRMILLVDKPKKELEGTHVLDYIKWGEKNGWPQGATCANRNLWYDLTGHKRGAFFWPMASQYKHAIAANDDNLICNHNLFDVYADEKNPDTIGGVLNSSFAVLSKNQYGRPVGVEGNLKTEVVDVNMMLVPDPRGASADVRSKIKKAFEKMKERKALYFVSDKRRARMNLTNAGKEAELAKLSDVSELEMADRRELDDAVLQLLGVSTKKRRDELLEALYGHLGDFYETVRQKEEKAIANKKRAGKGAPTKPGDIAQAVLEEIRANEKRLLKPISDFLPKGAPLDTYDVPLKGEPERFADMFHEHQLRFGSGRSVKPIVFRNKAQADLILSAWKHGVRGLVQTPLDETACKQFLADWETFATERDARIKELIAERTGDEDAQGKVLSLLIQTK